MGAVGGEMQGLVVRINWLEQVTVFNCKLALLYRLAPVESNFFFRLAGIRFSASRRFLDTGTLQNHMIRISMTQKLVH